MIGVRKHSSRMRSESGVAMVTVLFIGAALTAVVSVAAFTTLQEFRAVSDDRKSVEAVAYADAGIDRMLDYLKSGQIDYSKLYKAGCENPALTLPRSVVGQERGTFLASLRVFNVQALTPEDRYGPVACAARPESVGSPTPLHVAVSSLGEHPLAKREIIQVLAIRPFGLPIGHYANYVSITGNPSMNGVSIFSETQLYGRDKLAMKGNDPYYTLAHFWPFGPWVGHLADDPIPAATHAVGGLFLGSGGGTKPEFPGPAGQGTRHCSANDTRDGGIASQSLWDSDGSSGSGPINGTCPGQSGYPPTSKFTTEDLERIAPRKLGPQEHQALKDAAKEFGLYCRYSSAGNTCQNLGGTTYTPPSVWQDADIAPFFSAGVHTFTAYFEFESGTELANDITWSANDSWPCSLDPLVNRNLTIVVKNGGFSMASGSKLNGAVIVDGIYKYSGSPEVNGTIIAKRIEMSGNATFTMNDCWLQTLSGAFTQANPVHWTEIDR